MTNAAQITHESETQRQFVRLQLPAMADIDENRYTVKDLSSGGMAIRDAASLFKKGEVVNMMLLLPFADFSLDIELKAEIQHVDKKDGTAGCRFTNLNANQISILNHVIKSFMAGDVVGTDNIINVVSRENFVNVRKHSNNNEVSFGENVKRYGIYGLITLATLFLGFFIINNIMEKMFIVKTPYGQVQANVIEVLNVESGVFKTTLNNGIRTVKKGQVIGQIRDTVLPENSTNILSPCDCFIKEQYVLDGEYKPANAALFKLLPENSAINIEAQVYVQDIHRLNIGKEAVAQITGVNEPIKGVIMNIRNTDTPIIADEKQMSIVTIKPEKKLSGDLINRPAFVEFHL